MPKRSTSSIESSPVILIGLDAADWNRVRNGCQTGDLPVLSRLFSHGAWGTLASSADQYAGGVWPDFYTGRSVAEHGIYHNKLWNARQMRVEVPTDAWLGERPFYEELSRRGHKVLAIDVPMILGAARPLNGVYLGGWGTHDLISRGSWPQALWSDLSKRYGDPVMPIEQFGHQKAAGLIELKAKLIEATRQVTAITVELLEKNSPDFACIVLGATHRAGHYLWDASQVSDQASPTELAELEAGLNAVYQASDRALGTLLEKLPKSARILVFAVHGMHANPGWCDLGADLVDSLLAATSGAQPRRGLLYRLRRTIPMHWIRPLLTRMPVSVTEGLVRLWSRKMYDWSSTPYFPMPMDQAGYVRVNLRGRERDGIVAPEDYEAVCQQLERGFLGLQDAESGAPLVRRISRPWQEASDTAQAREVLPDLLIEWGDLLLGQVKQLRHADWPTWHYTVPAKAISGRSGNHVGLGWFVATGPGIRAGEMRGGTIRDLAPTVFDWMGESLPDSFEGQILPICLKEGRHEGRPE